MGLIDELKRRNVFRVGAAYVVLAWVVLQVTSTVAPALKLPDWTLTFFTWLGVIGFPFALLLAWAFELTPEGIKREYEVDRSESITHETGRKIDFIIIGLLVVALGFVVWDAYLSGSTDEAQISEPPIEGVASEVSPSALSSSEMNGSVARLPASSKRWVASVAVLPFVNMSGDPDNEYFSDGVSEELLHALSRLKGLKVPARTSSFFFKGKNEDIKLIGKTLGVEHVLEGSVRKAGERVRITAQLVHVGDGAHLWSETYDRELRDIFALQDEIATNIAQHLQVELGLSSLDASARLGTQNVAAYEHYLRAIQLTVGPSSPADLQRGIVNLQQAIELDPDFAAAHARLSWLYLGLVFRGLSQSIDKAVMAYNRALELDPNQALALIVKARLERQSNWDWANVEKLLRQAMAHGQSPVLSQANLATELLMPTGQMDEAEQLLRNAMELDPLQPEVQQAFGLFLFVKNDFSAVLEYLSKFGWIQRTPEFIATQCYATFGLGNKDGVRKLLQELRDFKPPVPEQIAACEVHWHLLNGDNPAAMAAYQRREALIGTSGYQAVTLGSQALRLGNIERAIDWFDLALRAQRPRISWVRTQHRENAELNAHPRYQALLREMNLDDESLRRMGYLQ